MHKITKNIEKELKAFADALPQKQYAANINATWSGADLLLANYTTVNGTEIDPEKEYIIPNVVYVYVNHERRLKRAFQSNGKEGIAAYGCKFFPIEKRDDFKNYVMKLKW